MDGGLVVRDMKLELLGEATVAESMCYLDNGYVFIGECVSNPIQSSSGFGIRIQGLKKRSKMFNNHNIILLFSDFYNILSFSHLLRRKSYNFEVI